MAGIQADSAMYVNRGVRDAVPGLARPKLRGVDRLRGVKPLRQQPGGLRRRQRQALRVDVTVGEPLCDGLEGADLAVELLALGGVFRGAPQRLVDDAALLGARREIEPVHQCRNGFGAVGDDVARRGRAPR